MKYLLLFVLFFFSYFIFAQQIRQVRIIGVDDFSNPQDSILQNFRKPFQLEYRQNSVQILFENTDSLITQLSPIETDTFYNYGKSAFYSHLEGGEYIFYLKNATTKQIIDSLKFSIEQPFYKKWWFFAVVLVYIIFMVGIIFYLFFNYRFRQQTKLQRVRNDIASDLHDDIGATLSSISFFGEMMYSKILKKAPIEDVLPLLEKVISTSKETIETMRGVVWTINPNNDNAVDFFQKLQSFGKEMLSAKNIIFHFQTEGFDNEKLSLDIQRNLFLFYKESINNIAKHSKATQVEVLFKVILHGECLITIFDNGMGFNPSEIYEGHGLKSLRKRADELHGKFEIKSTKGQGTTIILSFSLS